MHFIVLKKLSATFVGFLICVSIQAQIHSKEEILSDTVGYIVMNINSLESWLRNQEAFKLNFEDCNVELHQTYVQSEGYAIYSFWLTDLDEEKMKLEYIDRFGTWVLKLETTGRQNTIQLSTSIPSGNVNKLILYADEKAPLLAIGKAFYYAIRQCKSLDRFKK